MESSDAWEAMVDWRSWSLELWGECGGERERDRLPERERVCLIGKNFGLDELIGHESIQRSVNRLMDQSVQSIRSKNPLDQATKSYKPGLVHRQQQKILTTHQIPHQPP